MVANSFFMKSYIQAVRNSIEIIKLTFSFKELRSGCGCGYNEGAAINPPKTKRKHRFHIIYSERRHLRTSYSHMTLPFNLSLLTCTLLPLLLHSVLESDLPKY